MERPAREYARASRGRCFLVLAPRRPASAIRRARARWFAGRAARCPSGSEDRRARFRSPRRSGRAAQGAQKIHGFGTRELLADEAARRSGRRGFRRALPSAQHHQQIRATAGASVSRASKSRNTTPQRASNWPAKDSAILRSRRRVCAAAPSVRRHAAGAPCGPALRRGGVWDRAARADSRSRPAVTRPAATNSHSPSSTSLASRPVARTRSSKNEAPRCSSVRKTSRAAMRQRGFGDGVRRQQPARRPRAGRSRAAPRASAARVAAPSRFERRMRRKPAPHDLARQAQPSSNSGSYCAMRRGRTLRFPRGRGNLVALQLPDHLQRAVGAVQLRARRDVLPAVRKRMKSAAVTGSISRRRRPSVRRWMRASRRRWHHSSPPSRARRLKLAAQNLAFGFELRERDVDRPRRGKPSRVAQCRGGHGPDRIPTSRAERYDRRCRQDSATAAARRQPRRLLPLQRSWRAPRRAPVRHKSACHSCTGGSTISVSSASCSSSASRTTGQDSAATCAIAAGSSAPSSVASVRRQRAPHLHGPRAALLERRIVEIRVRIGVQNLVRERRRLGRVDGDGPDRARLRCAAGSPSARPGPSPRAGSCRWSRSPADDRECGSRPSRFSAQAA